MALRCPECGNDERFHSNGYIEHHEAVFDAAGQWVEDIECYDSELGDGAVMECPECGFKGGWGDFGG